MHAYINISTHVCLYHIDTYIFVSVYACLYAQNCVLNVRVMTSEGSVVNASNFVRNTYIIETRRRTDGQADGETHTHKTQAYASVNTWGVLVHKAPHDVR